MPDTETYERRFDDARFTEWLREQLDQLGPQLAPRRQRTVADAFRQTLEHELRFHAVLAVRAVRGGTL